MLGCGVIISMRSQQAGLKRTLGRSKRRSELCLGGRKLIAALSTHAHLKLAITQLCSSDSAIGLTCEYLLLAGH